MVDKNVIEQGGNVITGDVDRTRTIPFVNFPAEVITKKKKVKIEYLYQRVE